MLTILTLIACGSGFDTGTDDTAVDAASGPQEAPTPEGAPEPLPPTEACEGATLAPAVVYLDRTWSMATWAGCATGVRLECPGWAATYTLRDVVTGDVATFAAGPLVQDGEPRVARCGIVTDQGRGEVVIVWEG